MVGACSSATAAAACPLYHPTTIAALAGPTPTADRAGDDLAAEHVHEHRAAVGYCLGGGGCAALGSHIRSLIVAVARCLCVQRRFRVRASAGADGTGSVAGIPTIHILHLTGTCMGQAPAGVAAPLEPRRLAEAPAP